MMNTPKDEASQLLKVNLQRYLETHESTVKFLNHEPYDSFRWCAVLIALRYDGPVNAGTSLQGADNKTQQQTAISNEWSVLLTVRAKGLRLHRNLVALPGGKVETGETVVQAALREAEVSHNQRYFIDPCSNHSYPPRAWSLPLT